MEVKIDTTLPEFTSTQIVKWNCRADDSTMGMYDIILGKYVVKVFVLTLRFSEHVI